MYYTPYYIIFIYSHVSRKFAISIKKKIQTSFNIKKNEKKKKRIVLCIVLTYGF